MKSIHISDLSKICVTRERGREAISRLEPYLKSDVVEIDLDSAEVVSTSFLDELILHLVKIASIEKVVFKCSTSILEDKLARISGIRNTKINYQFNNGQCKVITPKSFEPLKASFVKTKSALVR